jgi:hypothetical protein
MKNFFIAIALIMGTLSSITAKSQQSGFDWDRVVYGGSIYPVFSNIGTAVTANPFVGYKITENFVGGLMFSYNYSRLRNWPNSGRTSTYSSFGVSPFVRYAFLNNFFAQAEYEFLNGSFKVTSPDQEARFGENNLFIGGGYLNRISNNSAVFVQLMYNVTWKGAAGNSVYASPLVYRVGFSIF